ncbi:MAG: histidine kinase, partial [Saprospiraceae bacterium]|nr:histidine kinase [Saprospiraceae bacterium]
LGRMYVATDEGFALVYPKGPETVRVPGARYPWSVHPAGDGGVYLSSYLDGLFYVNPETNTIRKYSLPSNDGKQHQLFPGKTTGPVGTPVFGVFRGVYFFYNDRLHLEPYGESIEAMAYDTLYERFLFAGKNLYVFDGSYPKTIYQSALPEALLQGDPCTDIDAAPDGSFWISGKGGVAFFSNKFELQHLYKLDAGVGLHAEVHCLATDAQGTLWAGGNVGVYRFQKTSNRWIRAFPGAVNAPVNDLVLLPENRMALLTDRSVVVVKTGDQPTITAIFDQSNGFTLLEPSENGACFDGRYLWVPAGNGLQRINLEVLGAGSASPAVRIDKINGRWMPFNVSVSDGVSDRAVLELSFIHLPPGSCEVWYRLGTEAWQEAAPGKRLEVEGLKHGVNTVQVQLRVRGNTLAETSCRITTNLPPLQRPGLRLLLGLALLAFVSALGFRIWQQRRLQSNLYQTQLRTVQAQLNPHVLFNLLSSLQNAIFNRTKEEASANLLRMSGMMREILEFSMPAEMETGKPFATITLAREIQFLDNFLTLEAMQTNPPFLFSIKNNIQLPADQVLLPPMLVQPLVENAVLHGIRPMRDRQGMIEVTFEQQDRRMIVRVEDNGKGPKQHPEPEVSSLRYRSRGGALLKERLLLIEKLGYRSTLTIEPREGGGTTATIQLENML